MSKKKRKCPLCLKVMGAILAAIVLIFVIPIVINEIYKSNTGYVTMWKASDVLSYYGTILGACVTICSLAATILFTKRQIQRDSYLKFQEEKWGNIEAHISKAIEDIHPTKLSIIISQAVSNRNAETIAAIERYSFQAKITLDSLFGFISGEDYKTLEPLLTSIMNAVDQYVDIAGKLNIQYQRLIQLEIRKNAIGIIKTAQQNPVLFKDYISESEKTLSETEGITEEMVLEELKALNLLLVSAREKSYREVLEKKRATFSRIKEQQAKEANILLSFGGNPNAHT